jgi:NAD(P)-dependent dehydrogenase (short-subunit alcohol dehydrogenase family)
MKILLIGSSGTIGSAVGSLLSERGHSVIGANFSSGEYRIDLGDKASIKALFERVGKVDALVSTAGLASFGALTALSDADFALGMNNKFMGQVNLLREGLAFLNDGGSITLTSGVLAQFPMPGSAAISPVNAAIEGFVRAAALELPRGLRINAASPVFVTETAMAMGMDTSHSLSAASTAKVYLASVEGEMTGQTLNAPDYA